MVKTEEIKISDSSLVFRPYWRVKGVYACRYKRIHSHKLQLEDDVESVTIYGKDQYVVAERKRLSDLLASVGADFGIGYGPLRMSLSRLEGGLKKSISSVLRSGDRELGKKVELEIKEIVEIAAFSYSGAFLFDPNLNLETKDTFELLNKRDLQPVNETNHNPAFQWSAKYSIVVFLFNSHQTTSKEKYYLVNLSSTENECC